MRTIVIVDPLWDGHHSTYFKIFAETFLKLDCTVIALCPNPEEMYRWISSHQSIAPEQARLFDALNSKKQPLSSFQGNHGEKHYLLLGAGGR
ncbi:hypothetical protein HC931_05330 [Candidatus Gracilibacteria bacterium]|nr:hypothetical protein [Candidatus Gracilibacteria bacterium]